MSLPLSGYWSRIVWRLLLPALVPLLFLVWFLSFERIEADKKEAHARLERLVSTFANAQLLALGEVRMLLEGAAANDDLRHLRQAPSRKFLARILEEHPELFNIALLNSQGTVVSTARGNVTGIQLGAQVYVREVMASKAFTVSRLLHDIVTERPALYCLVPILEGANVRGILLAALNPAREFSAPDAASLAGISLYLADPVGSIVPVRNGQDPKLLPVLPPGVLAGIRDPGPDMGSIVVKEPSPFAGLLAYVRLREPLTGQWVLTCAASLDRQTAYVEANKRASELFAVTVFCLAAGIAAAYCSHRFARGVAREALPHGETEQGPPAPSAPSALVETATPVPGDHAPETSIAAVPVARAPVAPAPASSARSLSGIAVLVADDSDMNRQVVKRMLEDRGIAVTTANNGLEALALLEASPDAFQAVFMDVEMPLMDGLTATRLLRENFVLRDLPVIAMTAYARPEEVETCRLSGMTAHLGKPMEARQLYDVVDRLVRPGSSLGCIPAAPPGEGAIPDPALPVKPASALPETGAALETVSAFLDMEPALARLGGNLLLYYNTASLAMETLPRQEQAFDQAFASGDRGHLLSVIYTLRVQGGTIGATALVKACTAMEHSMRADKALPGAAAVQSLRSVLGWTMEALERVLPTLEKQLPRHSQFLPPVKPDAAAARIAAEPACSATSLVIILFANLLRFHDATAPTFFSVNRTAFESLCTPGAATAMEQALRSFDYDAVLHLLDLQP